MAFLLFSYAGLQETIYLLSGVKTQSVYQEITLQRSGHVSRNGCLQKSIAGCGRDLIEEVT